MIGRPLLSETAPEAGPPGNESEEETVGWARRRSRRDGGLRQSGAPRRSSRPALARPPAGHVPGLSWTCPGGRPADRHQRVRSDRLRCTEMHRDSPRFAKTGRDSPRFAEIRREMRNLVQEGAAQEARERHQLQRRRLQGGSEEDSGRGPRIFREGSRRSGASSSRSRGTQPGLCVRKSTHATATREARPCRAANAWPWSRGQSLGNLTATSRPSLGCISAASQPHLGCISPGRGQERRAGCRRRARSCRAVPGRFRDGSRRRAACRRRARSSRATLGRRRRGPFRSRGRLHAPVR